MKHTVESLLDRTIDCAGCRIWQGGTNGGCTPTPKVRVTRDHSRESVSARRLMYELAFGPVKPGLRVTTTCESSLCIAPSHLKAAPRSEVSAKTHKNPANKARQIRALAAAHRPRGKLTMESARAIRARHGETHRAVAMEFGVSISLIAKVRANRAWVEFDDPGAWMAKQLG